MIRAWYEKIRDQKDHIYFGLHYGKNYPSESRPYLLPGFHNAVELAVGLEGSMDLVINGEAHVLSAGDICFINSREPHRYHYTKDAVCYVILISRDFFNEVNRLGNISFPSHMAGGDGFDTVREYLDYAIKHWNSDSLLCKRAFVDTLAYLMLRYYPYFPKKETEQQNKVFLDSVAYICEHYTEKLTVGEVAARFGYSANYFSTAFNEFMGSSFTDYVNTCRMIEYQRLRRKEPNLSATSAAEMCGFGSMNTFYRAQRRFENDQTLDRLPPERKKS